VPSSFACDSHGTRAAAHAGHHEVVDVHVAMLAASSEPPLVLEPQRLVEPNGRRVGFDDLESNAHDSARIRPEQQAFQQCSADPEPPELSCVNASAYVSSLSEAFDVEPRQLIHNSGLCRGVQHAEACAAGGVPESLGGGSRQRRSSRSHRPPYRAVRSSAPTSRRRLERTIPQRLVIVDKDGASDRPTVRRRSVCFDRLLPFSLRRWQTKLVLGPEGSICTPHIGEWMSLA
jgi:hypothetical protein